MARAVLVCVLLLSAGGRYVLAASFIRGDINDNGTVDLTDAVDLLRLHFVSASLAVDCLDSADVDDDGRLNLNDVVLLAGHLLLNKPGPAAPFPLCGVDPTPDAFDCISTSHCSVADGNFGVESFLADAGAVSVSLGDLDGDERPDLAVANSIRNSVSILTNLGGGRFTIPLNYDVGRNPRRVSIGDLNGDDRADLIFGNRGTPQRNDGHVSVLFNLGGGKFSKNNIVRYPVGLAIWDTAVADLDVDGDLDVVAVGSGRGGYALVFLNSGNGGLLEPRLHAAGRIPYFVAAGDLTGDGRPELVVADAMGLDISVMINRGQGRFGSSDAAAGALVYRRYHVGQYPGALSIADLDGDGRKDIAALNGYPGQLRVLLNLRGGLIDDNPGPAFVHEIGNTPSSLDTGDIDGDGDIDVVVASASNDAVSVFLNRGGGRLVPASAQMVGKNPRSVVMGDIDGDGDLDMAVANSKSGGVTVLLNRQFQIR